MRRTTTSGCRMPRTLAQTSAHCGAAMGSRSCTASRTSTTSCQAGAGSSPWPRPRPRLPTLAAGRRCRQA
eukprot:4363921-Alexandrium_andersonii.AAC.1